MTTEFEYEVQGWYGCEYEWERVCAEATLEEAEARLAEYRANEPQWAHRIRKVLAK